MKTMLERIFLIKYSYLHLWNDLSSLLKMLEQLHKISFEYLYSA
jgi:hypothetical protein